MRLMPGLSRLAGVIGMTVAVTACVPTPPTGHHETPPPRTSESGSTPGKSDPAEPVKTSPNGPARCDIPNLRVVEDTKDADHSMQGTLLPLQFTNTGSRPCTLQSAPGVSFVDGSGRQIGLPAKRNTGGPVVTLAPGETASARLFESSASEKTDACIDHPENTAPYTGLKVYPPGSYDATVVPSSGTTCTAPGVQPTLEVGSIKPGPANTE
jgi:hypothetical protein